MTAFGAVLIGPTIGGHIHGLRNYRDEHIILLITVKHLQRNEIQSSDLKNDKTEKRTRRFTFPSLRQLCIPGAPSAIGGAVASASPEISTGDAGNVWTLLGWRNS